MNDIIIGIRLQRRIKSYPKKEIITKHSILPLATIMLMGGRGVLKFSHVFNQSIS